MKICVLGAGTWGSALARLLRLNDHDVTLWSSNPEQAAQMARTLTHPKLPGVYLPPDLYITGGLEAACREAEMILFAVASPYVRTTAARARPFINPGQRVVTAAKGIEKGTFFTMSQVVEDELRNPDIRVGVVSGPTHAEEVARDMPTAMVAAADCMAEAEALCRIFSNPQMRLYPSTDVKGVEICGAFKNIIALAVGIARGLGYGDNAVAALITRGAAEIKRLGLVLGGQEETFSGLAGVGDLIVTCSSAHSRNMTAGTLMGRGFSAEDAVARVGMVVEGVNAVDTAVELIETYGVYMPITSAVYGIVRKGEKPAAAAARLMTTRSFQRREN